MNDLAQELKREVCTLIGSLVVDKLELQITLAKNQVELEKMKLANESRPHSEDSAADPAPRAEA